MTAPRCPRVTFYVAESTAGHSYEINAKMAGRHVGLMYLGVRTHPQLGRTLMVEYARVKTPRCGIGTKLYENAS